MNCSWSPFHISGEFTEPDRTGKLKSELLHHNVQRWNSATKWIKLDLKKRRGNFVYIFRKNKHYIHFSENIYASREGLATENKL